MPALWTRGQAMKKVTCIITADLHLREDQPVCRTDDFFAAQTRKLNWLSELQQKYNCPILDGGDLFHHWKPSPALLRYAINNLPSEIVTVPGNHDLPSHSMELYEKSGLAVLEASGKVNVLFEKEYNLVNAINITPFPWGYEVVSHASTPYRKIALCHVMTYQGRKPFPGCTAPGAGALLRNTKGYNLIITGHNHVPFVVEDDGRLLINPGSLMRTTAAQIDHKPRVYLYYAENNTIEPVFVPIKEGVITREHIDITEYRDDRIDAFISRLSDEIETGLSFEHNLESYFSKNRIRQNTKDLVWEAVRG